MSVCMDGCMDVWMYAGRLCMLVCVYVFMCVSMYVYLCNGMYVMVCM